jgi:hypothetical protein
MEWEREEVEEEVKEEEEEEEAGEEEEGEEDEDDERNGGGIEMSPGGSQKMVGDSLKKKTRIAMGDN